MLFDSPIYLLSLSIVVVAYWRLNHHHQNNLLLAFSYFFYGWWDWRFLGLIAMSTVVDFVCARLISTTREPSTRRLTLTLSIGMNLLFLGFFKYFQFFADSLYSLLAALGMPVEKEILNIVLPPGISFYTFQAIAYMVDVYHGRLEPMRSLRDYALFISLFPHLIAGPIQRPDHLLPQVTSKRVFHSRRFSDGILLILSGLFRKCVIADQCALLANAAFSGGFGNPELGVVAIGTYAFAWQIYGDFSGYSNIARGSAQLLGFHFMVNFRQPYLATSLQDFWKRWHISLSTWLRDYLYIPLGGSRQGHVRTYRNLLTTMLLGGLWHGANWTFVAWGGLHGAWLAIHHAWSQFRKPNGTPDSTLAVWIKRILLFHLVCLGWIFFRSDSLGAAIDFLSGLGVWHWRREYLPALQMLLLFPGSLFAMDYFENRNSEEVLTQNARASTRLLLAGLMLALTLLFSASAANQFVYFQF